MMRFARSLRLFSLVSRWRARSPSSHGNRYKKRTTALIRAGGWGSSNPEEAQDIPELLEALRKLSSDIQTSDKQIFAIFNKVSQ